MNHFGSNAQLLSCVRLSATPWTVAHQAQPLSKGFPRQEYWSGLPFPSPNIWNKYMIICSLEVLLRSIYSSAICHICKWNQPSLNVALTQRYQYVHTMRGDFSYLFKCLKTSANIKQVLHENGSICRCILDVFVRRDEFYILLFYRLDSSPYI